MLQALVSIRPKGVGKDLFDNLMGIKEDKKVKEPKGKSKTPVSKKKPVKSWNRNKSGL